MIKTIFFDLDDTLLDFTAGEACALSKALRQFGIRPTPSILERYHVINLSQWELLEEGKLTRDQVLTRRFDILFAELGVRLSSSQVCGLYERLLAEEHVLMPGARELLETLAPRYDLYLASNGAAAVQYRRLDGGDLSRYFRGIFISEEVGFDKPDRRFFDACFAAVPGFDPMTALMVGDSLTSDIRGGGNAGIRTCWFDPMGKPPRPGIKPDCRITALSQLPALLKRL